jgi:hypothetical protein
MWKHYVAEIPYSTGKKYCEQHSALLMQVQEAYLRYAPVSMLSVIFSTEAASGDIVFSVCAARIREITLVI